ncbi:ATPase AAA [Methanosarcina sp. 1.H.T.1A.1]|uniref:minichromosome maintenance protein MCM n=1 Tax=unclassified Methanosarcina TaxID=2644672 RepID=UPI00062174D7|nr:MULTISPECIES: minichromosome maintenance protein MCM [unclassified Methanosarcina]KKH46071.1 ATPase AAA [Methanosarcina sp. 1.H.A.2.2]KKH92252.1 ATPase AAA [Methanosarcina sp. 1.H.T.1A.1]
MTETESKWDEKLKRFFKDYYWNEILQLANEYPDQRSLGVDFTDIEKFDRELSKEFLEHPGELVCAAEAALKEIDLPVEKSLEQAHVRVIKIPNRIPIRELRSKHLTRFVAIEGMIRKATEVRPRITKAAFQCLRCGHLTIVEQNSFKFEEPFAGCEDETCGKKGPFKVAIEDSTFIDAQKLQIQESPENLKGGSQPQSLEVDAEDDLTGNVTPGDRVIINGVLKSRQRTLKDGKSTFYDLVLEANSIEHLDKDYDELEITAEDEEQILELSRDPAIYDKIIASIAPSIYGYEDIKEALALQLFSGVVKNLPDGSRIRGDIHMMLVGDPGIAKSQLLRYVVKLSPRGVFASGRSASASGLTAAAVKDDMNDGRWTIEGGALVMADMGVAAVDEMDKMKTEDKSALHEAMEQQTISIAKAGIIATLKSRCALLGAANPKYGRFDRYEGLAEQINMPPALLSRFDLIFVLLDTPNHALDSRIANHILQSHYAGELSEQRQKLPGSKITEAFVDAELEVIEPVIEAEIMRKYVAYARKNVYPVMEVDARQHLINFYTNIRKSGEGKNTPVPVTARQLEALVRLSEASARVRLSNVVTLGDAERTIKITMNCLKNVGVDPETGALDADVLASGTSMSQRNKIKLLKDIIKKVSERHTGAKAPLEEVYVEAENEHGIERGRAEEYIKKMKQRGDILSPDQAHIRLIN